MDYINASLYRKRKKLKTIQKSQQIYKYNLLYYVIKIFNVFRFK